MNDVGTQLNRVPSQDLKGSRRVAFTDSLPKHRTTSGDSEHGSRFCPRLFACCGWICIGVFGIVLAVLILGVIFLSFLQSGLPEITVRTLDLTKFEIQNSTNQDNAPLNSRVQMSVEMKNKNEKMELTYSNIAMNLVSEDVGLGKSVIAGFSHNPGNTSRFNLTIDVAGDSTDRENALELEDDKKKVQMDVQVTMEATIGFHLGIFHLNKVPIHVGCVYHQSLILYRAQQPPCNIRMFPTR